MTVLAKLEKKLPAVLQKRGVALLIAVLLAVVSVLGIGGMKLNGLVKRTEKLFYDGDNSVPVNISMRAECAANLLTLADTLPDAGFADQRDALEAAMSSLDKADPDSPLALSQADRVLEEAFFNLMDQMKEVADKEGKYDLMHRQTADFESAGMRISRTAAVYNEKVDRVNKQLHSFPAGLLRLIWGIGEAEPCV